MSNLAMAHLDCDNVDKAMELMGHVLRIRRKHLGDKHPDVARSMSNMALMYV